MSFCKKPLKGRDLIKMIQDNGFEDYDVYITTDGRWFRWCGDFDIGSKKRVCLW